MLLKANSLLDILNLLRKLDFINDIEIINVPEDVDAEISLSLNVGTKNSQITNKVCSLLSEYKWKIFD